jgi:hypothetical protein
LAERVNDPVLHTGELLDAEGVTGIGGSVRVCDAPGKEGQPLLEIT